MIEFTRKQNDKSQPISQTVTFSTAVNLTAASVQFICGLPDDATMKLLPAIFSNPQPSTTAATSVDVVNDWTDDAIDEPGVFVFAWKFTLADGSIIERTVSAATADYPDRKYQTYEVVQSLSAGAAETGEDGTFMQGITPTVSSFAEMRGLPYSTLYKLVQIFPDSNGNVGMYSWDATITAGQEVAGSDLIIAITDSRGGGFRRTTL